MTAPSSLRFAGRWFRLLASVATLALTMWIGTVASAQSDPPEIIAEPQSRTNFVGASADFQASVTGTAPLVYQWLFQGTNRLANATNAVLTLASVRATDAGNYSVLVANAFG